MNKIYLYHVKINIGNFGDEIGPYIIQKLSGQEIYQIPIPRCGTKLILAYINGLCQARYSFSIFRKVIRTLSLNGNYIMSIGIIIAWGSGKRIVWGSGIISIKDKIPNGEFLAVRGKYTQSKLQEQKLKYPIVLGDPALLLPLVYKPIISEKKYELGIIPHFSQYSHFSNCITKNIKIINLLSSNVETTINEICECKYIISTSLHGIIVAHAYGIPALWYEYPKIKFGENVKFFDYFSSVGIKEYNPFIINNFNTLNKDKEIENILRNMDLALIQSNLEVIQQNLLSVAPFKILNKYRL